MKSKNIRELMRVNANNLVGSLISEGIEFRLVIWNNDDWDFELPEHIMVKFPLQLILDFKGHMLDSSYVSDDGQVTIVAAFLEDQEFTKKLKSDDIVAVLELDGQPMQVNNFAPEKIDDAAPERISTKDDIIKALEKDGVKKEDALRSLNAFAKNNPGKFKILEEN